MTKLFGSAPAVEVVVESMAPGPAEVIVEQEIPATEKVITKKRRVHRRKAS